VMAGSIAWWRSALVKATLPCDPRGGSAGRLVRSAAGQWRLVRGDRRRLDGRGTDRRWWRRGHGLLLPPAQAPPFEAVRQCARPAHRSPMAARAQSDTIAVPPCR
jgi:hypothetical protein